MKGYVRKRGSKWSYTVDIGKDPITGKRKQKTKSGFKTKKEAEKALTEFQYEVQKGIYIEPKDIKIKEFAVEWIDSYRFNLRETTAEQYQAKINKWIIPLLGDYLIQDVKPIHGQTFVNKLTETLQPDTAHKVLAVVKLMMKHAVNLEIIPKNPFTNIVISQTKKKKMNTWTFEELNRFLEVVKQSHDFLYRVCAVAAFTGMRKGEVLGLREMDVDLENNLLTLKQGVSETKKGVQVGDLKTPSSYRQVAIDNFLSTIIREQIQKNNVMKAKFGKEYEENGLVFCHLDGKVFRPTSINRPFNHYIQKAKVPKIRFHDMRHTHATLMLELKVNPKVVADRLGHSSVKITLDSYTHASLDIQSSAANLFSESFRK